MFAESNVVGATVIHFDGAEVENIDTLNSHLSIIADSIPNEFTLVNPMTGECVDVSEIRRVMGILDGFAHSGYLWEVQYNG